MVSIARIAGILGLVSLVVPFELSFYPNVLEIDWTLFGAEFYRGGSYFFNISQFLLADEVLSALLFLFVLAGSLLLIIGQRRAKLGSLLLAMGILFYLVDTLYLESRASFTPVPLGFFLVMAASILARIAKPTAPTMAKPFTADSSLDKLAKLKSLLDSGAITQQEFDEQKRLILAGDS